MNSNEYNKWYLIVAVFAIIFTFFGGTLAYWQWNTNESERTSIALTVKEDFRCDVDGGGDITSEEKYLVPTDCTNSDYAIQRTITVNPKLFTNDLNINYQLQLKINSIDTGLRNSKNFKYALTTNPNSCTTGVIESGTFYGLSANKTVDIFKNIYTSTRTENYYLYIWLDKAETSTSTMDQKFSLSLTGSCTNDPSVEPEKPVLDSGMIPVTISNTGVVTTISEDDENWYDYSDKKWANVVLVNENATSGVSGSKSRQYYKNNPGTTVAEDDILAYYVWIPRYRYRITEGIILSEEDKAILVSTLYELLSETGYTLEQAITDMDNAIETGILTIIVDGQSESVPLSEFIELVNSELGMNIVISGYEKRFDVVFEAKASPISRGDAVSTYYTHPAFVWDGKNVGGIWVGKFLTGGTYVPDEVASKVNILPVSGMHSQSVVQQFLSSLLFSGGNLDDSTGIVTFSGSNEYGLTSTTDSHMMKNSEWGAVVYFAHSKYGINGSIRQSGGYCNSGCGNLEGDYNFGSYACVIKYGEVSDGNYPHSTTGNITGVFDMHMLACGINVMGKYGNDEGGFTILPESKYYDLYSSSQFTGDSITNFDLCTLETCGGHALYETKTLSISNFGGSAEFGSSDGFEWFGRGFGNEFHSHSAGWDTESSFRSVAIVNGA